jgi:histidine ammonia-lyase
LNTTALTVEQLAAAKSRYAEQDLKLARKHGQISVVETLRGCVELSYAAATKTYSITKRDFPDILTLAQGNKGAVKAALVGLYQVVEA